MANEEALRNMYDLIIIGAGPGGIALAAEARASGIDPSRTLILEKGNTHNWAIRQLYPEQKLTTANYKGFEARCEGLLCITDMTKSETIDFFDQVIKDYDVNIQYNAEVYAAHQVEDESGARFRVQSTMQSYETKVLAIAIGIFGRPNRPKEYKFPSSLKERLLFDMTSQVIEQENVLVVGGGDTASEYVQYLHKQGNQVTLSYRQSEFTRLNDQNRAALFAMEENKEVEILRSSNIKHLEDENGLPRVTFKEDHYESRIFDRVIYALGGSTPTNFLKMLGISFNEEGPIFDESGATNVYGLYLLGDLVVGKAGGSIITAFNSAVRAMRRMCTSHFSCESNYVDVSR